jgi:hypothetical protein
LLIGGGLLAILGAFLPWVSVSVDTFDESANGFGEGASDGYIVLVAALVAIVFGALAFQPTPPRRGVIILGIISAILLFWIGIANLGEIGDQAPGVEVFGGSVDTGIGLILVTLSAAVVLAGAIVAIVAQRAVNAAGRAGAGGQWGGGAGGGQPPQYGGQPPPQGYRQPPPQPQQQQPPEQQPPKPGQYPPPSQPGSQPPPG